jgi:hypothetical protein
MAQLRLPNFVLEAFWPSLIVDKLYELRLVPGKVFPCVSRRNVITVCPKSRDIDRTIERLFL